jgi:hypothetical protein
MTPNSMSRQDQRRKAKGRQLHEAAEPLRTGLHSIFPGESEMARLMRAFDWAASYISR